MKYEFNTDASNIIYNYVSPQTTTSSGYQVSYTDSNKWAVGCIDKTRQGNAPSTIDDDGKIEMSHNNIHIQPISNGFIVIMTTKHDGIKTYCFTDFRKVVDFMKELTLLDLDSELVAENV